MTGPEAVTTFCNGNNPCIPVPGWYTNWAAVEPNDYGTGEDYGHFQVDGTWNDYAFDNSSIKGYVVEYGGTTGDPAPSLTGQVTVNVVNNAPVLAPINPTMTSITEDEINNSGMLVSTIVGASISDADPGAVEGIAIYSLSSGNGTWQYSTNGGGSWNAVGAVATSNALLFRANDLVRFVPDGMNGTNASFSYYAWDQTSGAFGTKVNASSRGGATAFSTASDTASITVTDVNDAPVLDDSGTPFLTAIDEDDTTNSGTSVPTLIGRLGGSGITDVDAGAVEGIAVTNVDNSNGSWEYTINGGTNWFAVGSPTPGAARLLASNANTRIRFVPNANYNGTVDPAITFRAWDQTSGVNGTTADTTTNGGTTAYSTATETASITVNAVNDAPVLEDSGTPFLTAINEDDTSNNGTLVSAIIASAGGNRITDVDAGAVEGIAVIGVDDSNGTWQYSTNGGGLWTSFGAVSDNSAVLLADGANDRVRFVPNANWNGTVDPGITFRAWDRTDGNPSGTSGVDVSTNGTTTPYGANTETASITVLVAADLMVSKQAEPASVVPGQDTITYTMVVTNAGPSDVTGAVLSDTIPAEIPSPTWSCVATGGATCPSPGSGNINVALNLPENSVVTYIINGMVASSATSLSNTATITNPITELNSGDNSATVNTTLSPMTDLSISKSSERTGTAITYTIVVSNAGPSDANGATVSDPVPTGVTGFNWTCVAGNGAACNAPNGSGNINELIPTFPPGGVVAYTVEGTVTISDTVVNTATVTAPAGATDPVTGNNQAVDSSGGLVFLPIIIKAFVFAPDLVVESLVATSSAVTVTIKNEGNVAVTDDFWVDVYFNPTETPSLNHPWNTIADHGAVWGVTADVQAGDSLTLTTGDAYYVPEYSSQPPLPVGADVYALVDSVDYSTTYGAVQESNEGNNLSGPVTSTTATGQAAPVVDQGQAASREGLPPR